MDSSDCEFQSNFINQANSFAKILESAVHNYSEKACLGQKGDGIYNWKTFNEVGNHILKLKKYFQSQLESKTFYTEYYFKDKKHFLIGIFVKPCEEAFKSILSLHMIDANITVLPIFDNINTQDLTFILKETELNTIIVDPESYKKLNATGIEIQNIILLNSEEGEEYEKQKTNIIKFEDLLVSCDDNLKGLSSLSIKSTNEKISTEDKIILLNYTNTSAKGVLISEYSFLSTLKSLSKTKNIKIEPDDIYYSLTSLADIPEYLNSLLVFSKGGAIGYYSGEMVTIFDDIKILKPTLLYCFPKILIEIYEALQLIIKKLDAAKKNMIEKAILVKVEHFNQEGSLNHHIWDKLLFSKIKNSLGGKIRMILVGGGHLSSQFLEFLKICLSTSLVEIYGVTECCGVICLSSGKELDNKYLGDSLETIDVEIKRCTKVGFFSPYVNTIEANTKQYGELCVKGSNLFSGYFKQKTVEDVVDKEGFFHTGDYVILIESFKDHSLNFQYIDRIDNFIKSEQGFLISPSMLEEHYISSDFISNISIFQDDDSNLIGVVALSKSKSYKSESEDNKNNYNSNPSSNTRKGSFQNDDRTLTHVMYRVDKRRQGSFRESKKSTFCDKSETLSAFSNSSQLTSSDTIYSYDTLMQNPNQNQILKEEILKSFKIIWMNNKLKTHELLHKVYILEKDFIPTIDNGMLTSKLKLKRETLRKLYFNYLCREKEDR